MSDIALNSSSKPNVMRWLLIVAAFAAILIFCRLALEEDLSWMGWVVVAALTVILTAARWPYGALVVLIAMTVMPRFTIELSGWNARPEHFAVLVLSVAICVRLIRSHRKLHLEKLDYLVFAYVAANYLSSAFGSSSPSETLRWALLNNLAVAGYFLTRVFVQDEDTLRKAFRIFLAVGLAEAGYGILSYFSHQVLGTNIGVEVGQYMGDVSAPFGTLAEANHFGAYSGCMAVSALAMYMIERRRLTYLVCFFVGSVAVLLSFSRAALIATVVAALWVCWRARHRRQQHGRRTALLGLAVGLILLMVLPAADVIRERFSDLVKQGLTAETAIARVVEAQEALVEFSDHPAIGTGTSSFQLTFDWGKYLPEMQGKRTWVGNVSVRVLHDTGLLGGAIVLGFLISLVLRIRANLRDQNAQVPILVALAAGALLYSISFQATDGTLNAFPWVHLGLLTSTAMLTKTGSDASNFSGLGPREI